MFLVHLFQHTTSRFNEYLDIAKVYSTPKSASYINGMLDNIVKKLKAANKILK